MTLTAGALPQTRPRASTLVPVLAYHRFTAMPADSMTLSVANFESQLPVLRELGCTAIALADLVVYGRGQRDSLPPRAAAITTDDGHRSQFELMARILKPFGWPVTLFIYPSAISIFVPMAILQCSGMGDSFRGNGRACSRKNSRTRLRLTRGTGSTGWHPSAPHHDRNDRVGQNVLRLAAEQHAGDAMPAVRSHRDGVAAVVRGDVDDRPVDVVSDLPHRVARDTGFRCGLDDEIEVAFGVQPAVTLVLVARVLEHFRAVGHDVKARAHVQRGDPGSERAGELEAFGARLPLGLFGASTGAAAALVAAASRPNTVQAVVSRGGRPDLAREHLGSVRAATLLIVGGSDAEVLALNRAAFALLHCEKRINVVPRATHLFEEAGALETVARLASDWFLEHLRPAG